MRSRIKFIYYDIFTPQPVRGADIYFLRYVFYNWSDSYYVRVLQALVPALKPGARVLICDLIIPERGSAPDVEVKEIIRLDLLIIALYNAGERDIKGIRRLLKAADNRFEFIGVYRLEGCYNQICKAIWRGEL